MHLPGGDGPGVGAEGGGDVGSLLERARRAHDTEIRRLQDEVRSLRKRLADARGDGQGSCAGAGTGAPPGSPEEASVSREQAHVHASARVSALSDSPRPELLSADLPSAAKRTVGQQRQPAPTNGILRRMVQHPVFEVFILCMIVLNGAIMAAEVQYEGFDLAVWTGHDSASGLSSDVWPYGEAVFDWCEWIFGAVFALEVSLKIVALRSRFVRECWNCTDLALVVVWALRRFAFEDFNVQVLRIARLARLLRLFRLFKWVENSAFDPVYIIATSLKGSVPILLWAFLLLLASHVMLALVVNQVLHLWYFKDGPAEDQILMFEYFGNFSRTLFTMFEFTLANWASPARVLMEEVHEALTVYSILHKLIFGFAVIGIVNGVFIQETFKVATSDDTIMVRQTYRKERAHIKKMKRLFCEADADHSGSVDLDEWLTVCKDPWVQVWLKSQDIDVRGPRKLFHSLDDGDGRITAEELINGTARMKGQASPTSMVNFMMDVRSTLKRIEDTAYGVRQESLDHSVRPSPAPPGPRSLYASWSAPFSLLCAGEPER